MPNDHSERDHRSDGSTTGEFQEGVTAPFSPDELSGMSRKQFLALLAASAAFAASGCTSYKDKGEIVPYTRKPEEITPGIPDLYASTCTGCAQACGILVKTREGRPVKIDGNPEHPVNRGGTCAKGQASILGLYDPLRLRGPEHGAASREDRRGQLEEGGRSGREAPDGVRQGREGDRHRRPSRYLTGNRRCSLRVCRSLPGHAGVQLLLRQRPDAPSAHGSAATATRRSPRSAGRRPRSSWPWKGISLGPTGR